MTAWTMRGTPCGIMFHHFHGDGFGPSQGSITAEDLDRIIDSLECVLPAEEWLARAVAGRLAAGDVCLTFDDGLRCQYAIARPVLDARGLTAFWFVYSSVFEGDLAWIEIDREFRHRAFETIDAFYVAFEDELRESVHAARLAGGVDAAAAAADCAGHPFYSESDMRFRYIRDRLLDPAAYRDVMDAMMARVGFDAAATAYALWMDDACLRDLAAKGHRIGLHSHGHPTTMVDLSHDEQDAEYRRNADHIRRVVGAAPDSMAHPCDSYGPETLDVLSGLGIRVGFRANMLAKPNPRGLEYPREDHANLMRMLS